MTTPLELDADLQRRVQSLAGLRRSSPARLMLEAIRQYVERGEARESFRQEAQSSWAAYQQDGKHLTGAEVRAWLADWGSEDEQAAPRCTSNRHC